MPLTELHKKKRAKNFMVLGIIVVMMVVFYMITIIRLTEGVKASMGG